MRPRPITRPGDVFVEPSVAEPLPDTQRMRPERPASEAPTPEAPVSESGPKSLTELGARIKRELERPLEQGPLQASTEEPASDSETVHTSELILDDLMDLAPFEATESESTPTSPSSWAKLIPPPLTPTPLNPTTQPKRRS